MDYFAEVNTFKWYYEKSTKNRNNTRFRLK